MPWILLHCIIGKIFVQIGSHLGENSMKNNLQQVQNNCYAKFWMSLKWEPEKLSSRNLPELCVFMYVSDIYHTTLKIVTYVMSYTDMHL